MDEFYKNLARKAMSAEALFFNENGELLIIKPSYKDYWGFPGGIGELYETPWEACVRETQEEIGLAPKEEKKLLAVSYAFSKENEREYLQFIFYGGKLNGKDIKNIKLDGDEILEYKFIAPEKVGEFLSKGTAERIKKTIKALKNDKIVYLEI